MRPRMLRGPALEPPIIRPEFTSERLTFRPYKIIDAPAYVEMQQDPDTIEFLRWPERDIEQSTQHLRDRIAHDRLEYRNDFLGLAAYEKHTTLYIGDGSLQLRELRGERVVEVGWIVAPGQRGYGFGLEIATAMCALAFNHGLTVVAEIDLENTLSQSIAHRLGMRYTRTVPTVVKGRNRAMRWYELSQQIETEEVLRRRWKR